MIYLIVFALGTIIGSFLNVCIYRIPRGQSIVFPPSRCIPCGTRLKFKDMIPVISYITLKGRCRYCGEHINIIYPVVEVAAGLIYLFTFINLGYTYLTVKYMILFSGLIVVFFTDLNDGVIPDVVLLFMFTAGFILSCIFRENLLGNLVGSLLGCGALFLIAVIAPGTMGMGDVKLMAACGWYLGGSRTLLSLFLSFVIGGAAGLILVTTRRRKMKDMISFGPFLAFGTFISAVYGYDIIDFYLSMFKP